MSRSRRWSACRAGLPRTVTPITHCLDSVPPRSSCGRRVLVRRWFKDATDLRVLARDARVSIATAYRYLHEAIEVVAAHAPELGDVLTRGAREDWEYVCLDGALIPSVCSSIRSESGHDPVRQRAGPHRNGRIPEWASPAELGSIHDITAAHEHVLPVL